MRFEFSYQLMQALVAAKIKNPQLKPSEDSRASTHVNVMKFSKEDREIFRKVIKAVNGDSFNEPGRLRKMAAEIEALWHVEDDVKIGAKCKNLKLLAATINKEVRALPRRLVFTKGSHGALVPYFILPAKFHPATRHGNREDGYYWNPASVSVALIGYVRGEHIDSNVRFDLGDLNGHPTIHELFAASEYFLATDALLATYDADMVNYRLWRDQIGSQFVSSGFGIEDTDTDHKDDDDDDRYYFRYRYRSGHNRVALVVDGQEAKLVMDDKIGFGKASDDLLVRAKDMKGVDTDALAAELGISSETMAAAGEEDEEEDDDDDDDFDDEGEYPRTKSKLLGERVRHPSEADASAEKNEDNTEEEVAVKLPVHPVLRVFNLLNHEFVTCHVSDIKAYPYNEHLGDSLVLPKEHKLIVNCLLNAALSKYTDIVTGKATGVILLCSGTPGTGKTLTAEVYSEVAKRPLYSVQCSQLGTAAEELEKELLVVLNRATRWNAILLIDEADVYIHERGTNMEQNAIVGIFLRVLEYYRGILFFTTNRATVVDDAIISRTTAHIHYAVAEGDDRKTLWKILAKNYGLDFSDVLLEKIVDKFPKISGRSIRQLLRLSKMMVDRYGGKVTLGQLVSSAKYHTFSKEEEMSAKDVEDISGDR